MYKSFFYGKNVEELEKIDIKIPHEIYIGLQDRHMNKW